MGPGDLHGVAASRVLAQEAAYQPPVVLFVLVNYGASAASIAAEEGRADPRRVVWSGARLGVRQLRAGQVGVRDD